MYSVTLAKIKYFLGSGYFEVKTVTSPTALPPFLVCVYEKEMYTGDLVYSGDLKGELLIVHNSNGWLFRPW